MGDETPQTLIVKNTCGADAAERSNQAFTVAAVAAAGGTTVNLWLTGDAVFYATDNRRPVFDLPHATDPAELMEAVLLEGSVYVCTQCVTRRDLVADDFLDGVTVAGSALYVEQIMRPGTQAVVY